MDTVLVGLSGKPRSGKDTVGAILQERHGFNTYAFADYLKWLCIKHFECSKEELWVKKTKESRRLLQGLGGLLTSIDTNIFINPVVEKIKKDYNECTNSGDVFRAVITDVRREDELSLFSGHSPVFVENVDITDRGLMVAPMFKYTSVVLIEGGRANVAGVEDGLHEASKKAIECLSDRFSGWDYYISNSGTLDDLTKAVDTFMVDLCEVKHDKG